jgi:hypothetical protein
VVADIEGNGLQGAMVVALSLPDSVLTKYALSSGDGSFTLSRVPVGEYLLQVTFIGYNLFREDLSVTSADVDAGTLNLSLAPVGMDTLFVNPEQVPFVNRRDTLDYNVRAFPTRPNATVEDLLKRLPGIEVEADGSIKAQGEDVQKVLVEGKEFFGSDPTIATRNLPAEAVDRVQVYDKQSDMAEFTGIPDGEEERVIDLALNDDARDGHFGRLAGGIGADGGKYGALGSQPSDEVRHNETVSLNRFSPTTQLALVGNINNTNEAGFAGADLKLFQGGGKDARGGGGGPVGGNRQGFTESLAVGVNASRDFGEKNWIRSSYFLSSLDNLKNTATQQQQLLGDEGSSFSDQTNNQATDNLTHTLDLNAQYTISEGHDVRFRGGLRSNSSTIENVSFHETQNLEGQILNNAETTNAVDGNSLEGNGRLTWRKRLGESGRTLVAEGWANLSRPDVSGELMSVTGTINKLGDFRYVEILQEQTRGGQRFGQGQRLSLTQPLGTERSGLQRPAELGIRKDLHLPPGRSPVQPEPAGFLAGSGASGPEIESGWQDPGPGRTDRERVHTRPSHRQLPIPVQARNQPELQLHGDDKRAHHHRTPTLHGQLEPPQHLRGESGSHAGVHSLLPW